MLWILNFNSKAAYNSSQDNNLKAATHRKVIGNVNFYFWCDYWTVNLISQSWGSSKLELALILLKLRYYFNNRIKQVNNWQHTCVCCCDDKGLLNALAMIRLISTPALFLTHIDLSHWIVWSGSIGFNQANSSSQIWSGGGGRINSGRKWPGKIYYILLLKYLF